MSWTRTLFLILALATPTFAQPGTATVETSRRAEILDIAHRYASFEWTAGPENVLHGEDPDGVRVDTADRSISERGWDPEGGVNVGVPYAWGGFSTLEEFEAGIRAGKLGGHLPKGRGARASGHAVGVDCSGLVSQAWSLPQKQSTRSLGQLCYELPGYDELLPGDILNTYDAHVMIFEAWVDAERTRMKVVEAVTPSVMAHERKTADLKKAGYIPLRYRPLDPRWQAEALAFDDPGFEIEPGMSPRFEPDGDERGGAEALFAFDDSVADAKIGSWVRYSVSSGRDDPDDPTLLTRGVRGPDGTEVQLHHQEGERSMELLEMLDRESSFFATWLARMAPESRVTDLEVVSCSVQDGTATLANREFLASRYRAELTLGMPNGRNPLRLRVKVSGIWSAEVPLGGLLEGNFGFEVLGKDDAVVSRVAMEYALRAFGEG